MLWRGNTGVLGDLVIFPGGFGVGIAHSAVFIGLTSGVEKHEVAIAASGMYLSVSVGAVSGVSAASATFQMALRKGLSRALSGRKDASEVNCRPPGTVHCGSSLCRRLSRMLCRISTISRASKESFES